MNEKSGDTAVFEIDARRWISLIFIFCLSFEAFLVVADYIFNYLDIFEERAIRRIWNIAREQSIPTWFSSIQAQLLGATVLAIAAVDSGQLPRWRTFAWVMTGLFFLWIGIDDFAEIHERLGGALVRMVEDSEGSFLSRILMENPSFSWHTFIAPAFIAGGMLILAFVSAAFWRLRLLHYIILGFGCWGVAQSIDFVEGLPNVDDLYDWFQITFGIARKYGVTHTFKVVEETLEMLGTTLLWIGFLHYLAHSINGRSYRIRYER